MKPRTGERRAVDRHVREAVEELTRVDPPRDGWYRVRATLDDASAAAAPDLEALLVADGPPARRSWLKAAVLLLFGAAVGAAAVVPGSPLRDLLAGPERDLATRASGVAVVVPPEGIRVQLSDVDPGLRLHVELIDREQLEIEARAEASTAVFGLGASEVSVSGGGPGTLWIGAPRDGPPVSVELAGRELVRSRDGQLLLRDTVLNDPDVNLSLAPVEPLEPGARE